MLKIKRISDKISLNVQDVQAECCCHDCTEYYWSGKSCSRVIGCNEKAKLTSKTTTWW